MDTSARVSASRGFVTLLVRESHAEAAINAAQAATSPEAFDRMRGARPDDAPWNSYKIDKGVALIPIMGTLIPRGTFAGPLYGVTSYEGLRNEIRRAKADPEVTRIAYLVDSPGGYVSGVDATAAVMAEAAAEKPSTVYVVGMCCSAAYWLAASSPDIEIVVSPLSEIGSIGVVQAHFDMSKMLDSFGIKVTLLHAGAKKVDGNPYEALPARVEKEMTQRLEDLRTAFATHVAAARASMTVESVLATEAATYVGQEAVAIGLADRVGLLDADLDETPENDGDPYAGPLKEIGMKTYTQAELDQAVVTAVTASDTKHAAALGAADEAHAKALESAKTSATAEGHKAGAVAERARIAAILGADEAKGHEGQASYFAFKTDFSPEVAKGALASNAQTAPVASLDAEMQADLKPKVGAGGGTKLEDMTPEARGAAIAKSLLGKTS